MERTKNVPQIDRHSKKSKVKKKCEKSGKAVIHSIICKIQFALFSSLTFDLLPSFIFHGCIDVFIFLFFLLKLII